MDDQGGTSRAGVRKRTHRGGLDIRTGSVRQARDEAGLTLAQVAGQELTRGAIHHIETGHVRPTRETLQLIAERTGKPLSFFLDGQALAAERGDAVEVTTRTLETLAASRQDEDVLAVAQEILTRGPRRAIDEALARYHLGAAAVRLVQPDRAASPLERARQLFEEMGDEWMTVETMSWQVSLLHMREDPAALALAEETLTLCRRLHPVPRATYGRLLSYLGSIQLVRHEWAKAIELYEEALAATSPLLDLALRARMYSDLTGAYLQSGDTATAIASAHRALQLYELQGDRFGLVRVENNLGLALVRRGDAVAAVTHLERALELCDELQMVQGRVHVLHSLGEAYLSRGALDDAEHAIDECIALAERTGEKLTGAEGWQLRGRLLTRRDDPGAADRAYGTALTEMQRLAVLEPLATCEREYAAVLEERGDLRAALEHMKVAAGIEAERLRLGLARSG